MGLKSNLEVVGFVFAAVACILCTTAAAFAFNTAAGLLTAGIWFGVVAAGLLPTDGDSQ